MAKSVSRDSLVFIVAFLLIVIVVITTIVRSMDLQSGVSNDTPDASQQELLSYAYITAGDLYPKLFDNKTAYVIDVREPIDYEREHIEGSENIPLSLLTQSVKSLVQSKMIVIVGYAKKPNVAQDAIEILQSSGVHDHAILEGGYEAWSMKNLQSVSWGDPTTFEDQSKVRYISVDEARHLIDTDNNIIQLDVRNKTAYTQDHLTGSVNIPLEDLEEKKHTLSKIKTILVYGETPLESFRGGSKLFDLSMYHVRTLNGSYKDLK
jgi:rhodanese-related sulfurtransferase